ncbi:MAG: DUF255 domain-containing protein [Cyclobacteriaceae bacterium]
MKKSIIYISCLLFVVPIFAQGVLFEIPDWELVMKKAEKENKLIFLYANVYDCAPCDDLERYAFQDTLVSAFLNKKFINVSIDMESFPGIELAERFQVFVYPAMLFVNANGEVVHRTCGAIDDKQLLYKAKVALDDNQNLKAYRTKFYQGEKSFDFLRQYGLMLDDACLNSRSFIDYYFKSIDQKQWADSTSWMMIRDFVFDPYSDPFEYLTSNYSKFVSAFGKAEVDKKIYDVMLAQFISIYEGQDLTLFATQSLASMLTSLSFEGKAELQSMTDMLYGEQVEDWDLYAKNVVDLIKEGNATDSYQLNEFAWKFYLFVEDPTYLQAARDWMKRIAKDKPTPTNLDTYASLLYKTGDMKQAIRKSEEALLLATRTDEDLMHYKVQLEKFKSSK